MDATEPAGRGCMVVFGHVVWGIGEGGVVRGVVVGGGGGAPQEGYLVIMRGGAGA